MGFDSSLRSGAYNLGSDLLAPVLDESIGCDRAAGFFSSSAFQAAPEQWAAFFARGGKYRLICSPLLAAADIAAIRLALVAPTRALELLPGALEFIRSGNTSKALAAWLASGAIQMMVAAPASKSPGIYHEKLATYRDAESNVLALSGSVNESLTAWQHNFERVDLFSSWTSPEDAKRTSRIQSAFDEMWANRTTGLVVVPLQTAFLDNLLVARPTAMTQPADEPAGLSAVGAPPPEICVAPFAKPLRPHQEDALKAWAGAMGQGILAMATGAGKTLTALHLAARLAAKANKPLVILMIAPYIHLVDQWCENAAQFGLRPIRCAEGKQRWQDDLAIGVNMANAGNRPILSIAVTQATLVTESFQDLLARIRTPMLVVGDEVHNYASPDVYRALPRNARYRMGLSATPERHHDADGTQRLIDYFGPIVFRYELADAIRDGILTPYRYFPVRVGLDDDELETYLEISKQLARFQSDEDTTNDIAMRLLLKRARVLASARQKLPELKATLLADRSQTHILIYCGDGQVEGDVPDEQMRQVEAVVRLVGRELGMRCASYTAVTSADKRKELLKDFAAGTLQVLVAIRCLDEGVDVPAARTAYLLASSSNPRQFVQRRGRVLRKADGKSSATIYDFMAIPDLEGIGIAEDVYRAVRGLVGRELRRAADFAELAINGPQARAQLLDLTEHLGLYAEWLV